MYNEVILNNFVLLDDNESEMNQTHMTDNAFGTLNFLKSYLPFMKRRNLFCQNNCGKCFILSHILI